MAAWLQATVRVRHSTSSTVKKKHKSASIIIACVINKSNTNSVVVSLLCTSVGSRLVN